MTVLAPEREAALLRAAQKRDGDAYAELVRAYQRVAYRAASFIAGPNDAEDATQLAFVKAYYALGRFQVGRPFQPWLLQIVVNEAKNARRAERRRAAIFARATSRFGSEAADDHASEHAARAEGHRHVAAALERLSAKHRDVVACRYLLYLSEEETAFVLKLRPGTVKSRLSRALERLRVELERSGDGGRTSDAYLAARQGA
jgi:RNA polymerase sigma factor (sigma-70 family)